MFKNSLAFRKPAVAAASRRPARADSPKVGLDGPAGVTGVLHESLGHECLKSSLAFRKPAVAVVSRCPARTEGL